MPGNFRIILEMTGKLHEERIAFKFHFQYNIEDITIRIQTLNWRSLLERINTSMDNQGSNNNYNER